MTHQVWEIVSRQLSHNTQIDRDLPKGHQPKDDPWLGVLRDEGHLAGSLFGHLGSFEQALCDGAETATVQVCS